MVVRNLRTVRQIYHCPNAATIQKYELSDFEAHCPCRIPDVSIITKQNKATTAKIVVANGIVDTAYALFRADRVCDSPRLADTSEMHVLDRARLLFPCKVAWHRKTQCLQTPIFRASVAPAITRRSVVFDVFRGLWSREKTTLAHRSHAKSR
jgi:hypothetical protein